jgi:hypothetical protein
MSPWGVILIDEPLMYAARPTRASFRAAGQHAGARLVRRKRMVADAHRVWWVELGQSKRHADSGARSSFLPPEQPQERILCPDRTGRSAAPQVLVIRRPRHAARLGPEMDLPLEIVHLGSCGQANIVGQAQAAVSRHEVTPVGWLTSRQVFGHGYRWDAAGTL